MYFNCFHTLRQTHHHQPPVARFDAETGEPEYDHEYDACGASVSACAAAQPIRKIPGFNVPRELLSTGSPTPASRCGIDGNENYSLFPKVQVLTLQEVRIDNNFEFDFFICI